MWWRQAFLIANKDFKLVLRDRVGLLFILGFPIIFATAFFFLMQGQSFEEETLSVYLATREAEDDAISRQIIDGMVQAESRGVTFEEISPDEGLTRVDEGEIPGVLIFPAGFTRSVYGEGQSEITVKSGGSPSAAAALESIAHDIARMISLDRAAANAIVRLSTDSPMEIGARVQKVLGTGAQAEQSTADFQVTQIGEAREINPAEFTIPGYLVMFVFFASAFTAETVARERENRTLERLLTVGAGKAATLGGKFIKSVYQGAMQVTLLWIVGIFAFSISLGDAPVATILVSALMVIASASFGVMLASFAKTVRAAAPLAVLVSLVAAPIGGCWWPLFIVPEWMQAIAKFTPHGWANTAFNRLMLFGGDFASVTFEMVALVGFAIGFAVVAVWRFRVVE